MRSKITRTWPSHVARRVDEHFLYNITDERFYAYDNCVHIELYIIRLPPREKQLKMFVGVSSMYEYYSVILIFFFCCQSPRNINTVDYR